MTPLAWTRRGRPGARELVLVHGFTQTAASWEPVASHLEDAFILTLVDAPGHGGSSALRADLGRSADLLAALPAAVGSGAVGSGAVGRTWVGYSMGARMVLHLALAHPGAAGRLVLVSGTAGIDDPDERAARRASDEALARRLEEEGVEAFLRWWLARPLFATLPAREANVAARLANTADGLASSLRLAGTGNQEPLWDRLGEVGAEVLVVAGERDPAYRARAERLAAGLPRAELVVVPGAGHACHLERPAEVAAALARFAGPPQRANPTASSAP